MAPFFQTPPMLIFTLLTFGIIFVNGWTDAPNAIATCITTRALSPVKAVAISAVFNFLGVCCMAAMSASVAFTVHDLVDLANDPRASAVICAALAAVIVWAATAWYFGIPTSESHALIAGLSGAAFALRGTAAWRGDAWLKVGIGLTFSVTAGFTAGFISARATELCCARYDRLRSARFFKLAQIAGSAAMSFMHGAQDGQKFMGVLLLGLTLNGKAPRLTAGIPWLCAAIITFGTSLGGYRIIKKMGFKLMKPEPYQGFCADLSAAVCLFACSLCGIPASTTHTKTTAMMGVGVARRASAVDLRVVREMAIAWITTFPACGILGFTATKLILGIK